MWTLCELILRALELREFFFRVAYVGSVRAAELKQFLLTPQIRFGKFKLGGHIDPDLFDVFMWQKVYLKYAQQCMDKHQIDDVDLAQVPGYVVPPAA